MIYLDTSVALAHLLAEERSLNERLWQESLVSSRLLTYEIWTRLHAYTVEQTHRDAAQALINRVSLVEMTPTVLEWIVDSIPRHTGLRTLDAIHLATCVFLVNSGQQISLASYDERMSVAAKAVDIPMFNS